MPHTENEKTEMMRDIEPIIASLGVDIPRYRLNNDSVSPEEAYRHIKDELLDEGNARQNLATFCQTLMDEEATRLMGETLEKNAIDKSEYPRTAEIEKRCINIIADLWNAPTGEDFVGTSTVGSSEACMLAGLAMKFRWREKARAAGLDIGARLPNIVISSGYQVCWEKFCVYWDIELRAVPMSRESMRLDTERLADYIDDYTIGVVGILGITYTGCYDDMEAMNAVIEDYNRNARITVPIHVDAASGGMFAPFVSPEIAWDFRLKNVVSINTSGHKYGLVYPGIGWALWRSAEYLPKELVFNVSYLGGEMPTMSVNFSRSAAQIIGQYYTFIRYGFSGFKAIHERTRTIAQKLADAVERMGYFDIYSDGSSLPVVCYGLREDADVQWTLYDLSDRLQMKGWQIPSYPLPKDIEDIIVHRYVLRADFSAEMALAFVEDLTAAISELDSGVAPLHIGVPQNKTQGFTH